MFQAFMCLQQEDNEKSIIVKTQRTVFLL